MEFHNHLQWANLARSFESSHNLSWSVVICPNSQRKRNDCLQSRPMVRTVLKRHTFNADPLSISIIGTLAPMHSMLICKGLVWVAPLGGNSLSKKARRGWDGALTPMMDSTSCSVVSMGTSFPLKASKKALWCLWEAISKPHTDTWAWVVFNWFGPFSYIPTKMILLQKGWLVVLPTPSDVCRIVLHECFP